MKKAFSLIEILLVISIIGLLMLSLKSAFSYENVNKLKFDTCYLNTYNYLNKFGQQAILQKSVRGQNGELLGVNSYDIKFDKQNQNIEFIYSGTNISKIFSFTGSGTDNVNDCYSTLYHTFMSGDNIFISIQPGLQTNNDIRSNSAMQMYSGINFDEKVESSGTGEIFFYYCKGTSSQNCEQRYKISIIPRVQLFKSFFCKKLDSNTKQCIIWSE